MGDIYTNPPQSRNEAILRATIDGTEYTDPPESRIEDLLLELKETIGEGGSVEANPEGIASETLSKLKVDDTIYSIPSGGGGGGTSDYTELENKPQINGTTLAGDKSAADLGLVGSEIGKGLSSNDYTNADKEIVEGVTEALADKVDKVAGKGLSTNDFTDAAKDKLDGIAAGAEVNVQPDWNESNSESDAFIKNKPTIPAAQVNADWEASSGKAEILHKPTLGTAAAKDSTNSVTAGSADLVESGAVAAAIGDKANKVSGATSGNLASLTSGGDLADSGKKASDFSKASIADSGTAGASTTSQQQLTIDGVSTDISGSKYMEQTINAQANVDTTFTFTNAELTYASVLDIFAGCKTADYDIPTLKSKTLSVSSSTGTLTLVYNVPTAYALTVRVYIRG